MCGIRCVLPGVLRCVRAARWVMLGVRRTTAQHRDSAVLRHAVRAVAEGARRVRDAMGPPLRLGSPMLLFSSMLCCFSCTAADCAFLALEGPTVQGQGSCASWSDQSGTDCLNSPTCSLLSTPADCAKPNQTCAQFGASCSTCATATRGLNCGWCASTHTCEAGTHLGPNSGTTCDVDNSGWGFGIQACRGQAACNAANGAGCTACANTARQGNCGYCASTGRCEVGNSTGPIDRDCAGDQWQFGWQSCPAPDQCRSYTSCNSCEDNAPAAANCGWS